MHSMQERKSMTKNEREIMQKLVERYLEELEGSSIPGITTDFRLKVANEGREFLNNVKVVNALSINRNY